MRVNPVWKSLQSEFLDVIKLWDFGIEHVFYRMGYGLYNWKKI